MVCVGEGFLTDLPGLNPWQLLLIHENAHEFGDGDRRVSVIELNRCFGREFTPGQGVAIFEATDNVGQGTGNEEILLNQAQFLAGFGGVIGVENLRYGLGDGFFPECLDVTALVENFKVKVLIRLSLPEAQHIDSVTVITNDRDVPRKSEKALGVDPFRMRMTKIIEFLHDMTIEFDGLPVTWAGDLPGTAIAHPGIRMLDLFSTDELLAEKTKFVVNAIANGREIHRGERIHEACSKAAKTTIAEAHVGFFLEKLVETFTHLLESLLGHIVQTGVAQVILKQAPHEILEGKIMNAAHTRLAVLGTGFCGAVHHAITNSKASGNPPVIRAGRVHKGTKREADMVDNGSFEAFRGIAEVARGRDHK